jgi:hypothetical protein
VNSFALLEFCDNHVNHPCGLAWFLEPN